MKRILALLLALIALFAFTACKDNKTDADASKDPEADQFAKNDAIKLPDVVKGSMVFKDLGVVTFEIYPNVARQSALNFIYLVNSGHFNGVIVDRLVKDFVIQAGDYQSGFVPRDTEFDYTIKGEFKENGIENTLHHMKGTMSWARSGDDFDSAHTEFCIYTDSTTSWDLDGKYAAFGMVYGEDSFKVLEKINKRKTYAEKPKKEIMITSVTLEPVEQPGFESTFEFPQPNFIRKEADTSKTSGKAN
ncbi:MAG: peptidylprolyl isomerase [Clostridia bacterium]|nr:peptidylprolyl isomerase [Clostridia bacterium]